MYYLLLGTLLQALSTLRKFSSICMPSSPSYQVLYLPSRTHLCTYLPSFFCLSKPKRGSALYLLSRVVCEDGRMRCMEGRILLQCSEMVIFRGRSIYKRCRSFGFPAKKIDCHPHWRCGGRNRKLSEDKKQVRTELDLGGVRRLNNWKPIKHS